MTPRRSDTRERIQQVALELFSEQGYEKTSLREIAERLGVTKAALYYHFTTKEEILGSLVTDVARSIDELLDWARSQPRSAETRQEILHRLADLVQGRWRPLVRFAEENQPALRSLEVVGKQVRERTQALFSLFDDEMADLTSRLRARLAIVAVLMGNLRDPAALDATEAEMTAAVLEVALDLLADRPSSRA